MVWIGTFAAVAVAVDTFDPTTKVLLLVVVTLWAVLPVVTMEAQTPLLLAIR